MPPSSTDRRPPETSGPVRYAKSAFNGTPKARKVASAKPAKPARARICLDAGHPSFEDDKLYEAIINRKVVYYLKKRFKKAGFSVHLTARDIPPKRLFAKGFNNESPLAQASLVPMSVKQRVEACEEWNANYLISVHHNFASNKKTNHTMVLYGKDDHFKPWHPKTKAWADGTRERLFAVMKTTHSSVKADQDLLRMSLGILATKKYAGILTEGSFYSNPSERKRLNTNKYLANEAKAIFEGFLAFFKHEKR